MYPFFQNKFVKIAAIVVAVLAALFIALLFLASMNSARDSSGSMGYAPSVSYDSVSNKGMSDGMMVAEEMGSSYYPGSPTIPVPAPDGYTSGLESYETTSYRYSGNTRSFDQACDALVSLKSDSQIHFKSINQSTNNCNASFFAEENKVDDVLQSFESFKDIEMTRNTSSVTRHRQQLQSRTAILQQQLARTEKTLAAAEAQLERLNSRFQTTDEVTALSSEVTKSLQFIDQMTNKKISLISQLDNAYQQAADLEERIEVVEFSVNLNRSNPIYPGLDEKRWETAWEELKDVFTDTLIGLTTVFGIFLLWAIRTIIYLLVLIVILRGLWKFGQLIWRKW